LDLRVKETCFISTDCIDEATLELLNELTQLSETQNDGQQQPETIEEPSRKRQKMDFWGFVKKQSTNEPAASNLVDSELDRYYSEPLSDPKTDFFQCWFIQNLYQLIDKYLCIPAISCPSESLFKSWRNNVQKKKSFVSKAS
jgi:hypothetical protein